MQASGVRPVPQQQLGGTQAGFVPNYQPRPSWHSPADTEDRKKLQELIYQFFHKRKPDMSQEYNAKLPEFVNTMEEALYNQAGSKEEYINTATLEARLHNVAKRLVGRPNPNGQHHPQAQQLNPGAGGPRPDAMNGAFMGNGMMPQQHAMNQMPAASMAGVPVQSPQQFPVQQGGFQNQQFQQQGGLMNGYPNNGMVPMDNGMRAMPQQVNNFQQQAQPINSQQQLASPNLSNYSANSNSSQAMPNYNAGQAPNLASKMMANNAPVLLRNKSAGDQYQGMIPNGAGPPKINMNGHAPEGMIGVGQQQAQHLQAQKPMQPNPMGMAQPSGFIPTNPMPAGGMIPINNQPAPMVPMNRPHAVPQPSPVGPNMVPINNAQMPMANNYNGGGHGFQNHPVPNNPAALNHPSMQGLVRPSNPMQQLQSPTIPGSRPDAGGNPLPPGGPQGGDGGGPDQQRMRMQYVQKQQRWLLFLRHCAKCSQNEESCQYKRNCRIGKELWHHILTCTDQQCKFPRCVGSRDLLKHHQKCQSANCPICTPVKEYVKRGKFANAQAASGNTASTSTGMPTSALPSPTLNPHLPGRADSIHHPGQQPPPIPNSNQPQMAPSPALPPQQHPQQPHLNPHLQQPPQHHPQQPGMVPHQNPAMATAGYPRPNMMVPVNGRPTHTPPPIPTSAPNPLKREAPTPKPEPLDDPATKRSKTLTSVNMGSSLLETFTGDQIRRHIKLIREAAQQQLRAELMASKGPMSADDKCTVCQLGVIKYEPPAIVCTSCGTKIKRGATYYVTGQDVEPKSFWCHGCYTATADGVHGLKKAELQKKKNDDEIDEGWVACDTCDGWVHQVCGLFNKGRNEKDTHFLCPTCLLDGLEKGKRERLVDRPQSMLESRDLPTCHLSNYLEAQLVEALAKERAERADKLKAERLEDVPTAGGLTVRVINSVVKKCEVKPRFYDAFRDDNYPSEFPYRQKVVVLFQNLDGVDVCLFTMYVQEYGADCPAPNRNCVYLSYLDSVKYFQPEEVRCVGGQALRTYVYHELLIAYLAYVKQLGFEQMYIWACPPMQGDDYILYCHPARQKTPQGGRLRRWYLDMLRRAEERGIVAYTSNLWDTYFEGGRDHRIDKCSAAHIPYLEGDYWPGEAENLINDIQEGVKSGKKNSKVSQGGRKSGSKGKRYGKEPTTTDEMLLARLGEILGAAMKEDFIVVHMQQPCQMCRTHLSGNEHVYRYVAEGKEGATSAAVAKVAVKQYEGILLAPGHPPAARYQICGNCHQQEGGRQAGGEPSRLPQALPLSALACVKLEALQLGTDPDGDIENEFFDTRQNFLNLCQGNHYQFDTLRRAKHSSMMVLYHLHNPSAPAFASTCNVCNTEIEPGQGLRCTVCQDFDMCRNCVSQGRTHEHPLVAQRDETMHTSAEARKKERRERAQQLQRTMALLVHACSCNSNTCGSTSCRKVRTLFQHAVACQKKVSGGCQLCRRMWALLNLHAKHCARSDCAVPRCKELKDLRRRQTARQEEQRRAAYRNLFAKQQQQQAQQQLSSQPDS